MTANSLFPSPISNQVLLRALKGNKQFKIKLAWSKLESYVPQYNINLTKIKLGTYIIVYCAGYYNIAIVNRKSNKLGCLTVQHIPPKKHIKKNQSLPSGNVNYREVKAILVKQQ